MAEYIDVVTAVLMMLAFIAGMVAHCVVDWYLFKLLERNYGEGKHASAGDE